VRLRRDHRRELEVESCGMGQICHRRLRTAPSAGIAAAGRPRCDR
jgi:hypothetical protein